MAEHTHYYPPFTFLPAIPKAVIAISKLAIAFSFLFALTAGYYVIACICIALFFLDSIDGVRLVPITENSDQYWQFIDTVIDRLVDAVLISTLAFVHLIPWEMAFLLLIITFLTSYTRTKFECLFPDLDVPEGLLERNERMIGIMLGLIMFIISPKLYGGFTIIEIITMLMISLSVITVSKRLVDIYILCTRQDTT